MTGLSAVGDRPAGVDGDRQSLRGGRGNPRTGAGRGYRLNRRILVTFTPATGVSRPQGITPRLASAFARPLLHQCRGRHSGEVPRSEAVRPIDRREKALGAARGCAPDSDHEHGCGRRVHRPQWPGGFPPIGRRPARRCLACAQDGRPCLLLPGQAGRRRGHAAGARPGPRHRAAVVQPSLPRVPRGARGGRCGRLRWRWQAGLATGRGSSWCRVALDSGRARISPLGQARARLPAGPTPGPTPLPFQCVRTDRRAWRAGRGHRGHWAASRGAV